MHVNNWSLLPKFVFFTALAHSANPDVLAVSESWLRKATKNPEISIPNYNILNQDRTAKGDGVAISCRDSLQSSVLLSRSVPKQFELLLLKIHLSRNKSLTVAACYRPPSTPSCALDTQMIKEPTRYNPKSKNTGTLINIILTNLPSKYTLLSSTRISAITASLPASVMGLRSNHHSSSRSNAP